jgi:hypothetical protein
MYVLILIAYAINGSGPAAISSTTVTEIGAFRTVDNCKGAMNEAFRADLVKDVAAPGDLRFKLLCIKKSE